MARWHLRRGCCGPEGRLKGAMVPGPTDSFDCELALPDLAATQRLARALAQRAVLGDVIALHGDLGCGKTTFARAYINALPTSGDDQGASQQEEVPSPTFTLVQIYERRPAPVWHFDLYRIEHAEEVYELGIEEAFAHGISLIEWPVRLGPLLPSERLDLELIFADSSEARRARLRGHGAWRQRLAAFAQSLEGAGA